MAKIKLLLQAFGTGLHGAVLKDMLGIPNLKRFVASVAFVREEGVDTIAAELKAKATACVFFIGIRNDITSVQAVRRLLELGVKVFAVDTASRSTLFHPKMFMSCSESKTVAVIGSANLTFSGLHNNIEASTVIHLDPQDGDDAKFIKGSLDSVDELPGRFPDHVFQIKSKSSATQLFNQGRLIDEEIVVIIPPRAAIRTGERDELKPINLPRQSSLKRGERIREFLRTQAAPPIAVKTAIQQNAKFVSPAADFILIWESKELTERDLNIPTGKHTNATGSMLWKKGAVKDIDQRHFFRDEVFAKLSWKADRKIAHYQRAEADFTLIIKGLNYGIHRLKLSHNTKKTSATYKQKNAMTSVSWGAIAGIIGKRDLLDRAISLYRNGETPPRFLLEID